MFWKKLGLICSPSLIFFMASSFLMFSFLSLRFPLCSISTSNRSAAFVSSCLMSISSSRPCPNHFRRLYFLISSDPRFHFLIFFPLSSWMLALFPHLQSFLVSSIYFVILDLFFFVWRCFFFLILFALSTHLILNLSYPSIPLSLSSSYKYLTLCWKSLAKITFSCISRMELFFV